ncbi:MAG: hypothetical protein IKC34_04545 [Clostridia bacterium]|nr:hypothetical protein [Clostridia bacterium]
MMKNLLKLTAILLIIAALPLSLISCDRKYDEEEVKAAAKELIAASIPLNDIYYGEGVRYLEYSERNVGVYFEADPAHLIELGFSTLSDLKTITKKVFSEAHSERMFAGSFSGTFTQNGSSTLARYYQQYTEGGAPDYVIKPDYIMVYSEYENMLKGEATYDLDGITVKGSKGQLVYVTVGVEIVYGEKTQKTTLEIALFEEETGWRLNSPTYASYNEYLDIYDQLQK